MSDSKQMLQLNTIKVNLEDTNQGALKLYSGISEIEKITSDVDVLLRLLDDIPTLLLDVKSVSLLLVPFPIVGVIAQGSVVILSKITLLLKSMQSIISPCESGLDNLDKLLVRTKKELHSFINLVQDISKDIGISTQVIQTLDSLLEMGKSIVNVLQNKEDIAKFKDVMNKSEFIKNQIFLDSEPMLKLLRELSYLMEDFTSFVTSKVNSIGKNVQSAISSVEKVETIVHPVIEAMNKVKDELSPVQWALDEIESLVKKFIEPVVHEVLKITGLELLVNDLEDKITQALNINHLLSSLENFFHLGNIEKYENIFNPSSEVGQVSQITTHWNSLGTHTSQAQECIEVLENLIKIKRDTMKTRTTEDTLNVEILNWTTYTHYLAGLDGFIILSDTIIMKHITDATKKVKVDAALKSVYIAVQDVNKEFINGINAMKNGKQPTVSFPPSAIPAWPSTPDKGMFSSVWQIVKPSLQEWESKVKGDSVFEEALVGLIEAGDSCTTLLDDAFTSNTK